MCAMHCNRHGLPSKMLWAHGRIAAILDSTQAGLLKSLGTPDNAEPDATAFHLAENIPSAALVCARLDEPEPHVVAHRAMRHACHKPTPCWSSSLTCDGRNRGRNAA